jgi:MerR family transcriptional regulator, copper efflux regulator
MNVHVRELTIGALAKAAGVSTPTVRYYEDIGLLPSPSRTSAGQRFYVPADLSRLTFIKQCRDFGFGIEQVRVLLALSISPERDCVETRNIAQSHLDAVRQKLAELLVLESRLKGFVDSCNAACVGGPGNLCTITRDITATPVSGKSCCG